MENDYGEWVGCNEGNKKAVRCQRKGRVNSDNDNGTTGMKGDIGERNIDNGNKDTDSSNINRS